MRIFFARDRDIRLSGQLYLGYPVIRSTVPGYPVNCTWDIRVEPGAVILPGGETFTVPTALPEAILVLCRIRIFFHFMV